MSILVGDAVSMQKGIKKLRRLKDKIKKTVEIEISQEVYCNSKNANKNGIFNEV